VATKEQKIACLKTLRIVVKNLADPSKNSDPKYRQLKLSNEKVKAKISPCPSAVDYMKAIGFVIVNEEDGEEYLRIESSTTINTSHMNSSLCELNNAIDMLQPKETFIEEKKTPEGIIIPQNSSLSTTAGAKASSSSNAATTGKMSEKQKARLLMEKKREREVQEAKAARKKTANLIKQGEFKLLILLLFISCCLILAHLVPLCVDKYVRENDPNWTSKQSAACVKSGSGINTFRDKFGEN